MLQPGSVVDAQVLQVLADNLVRIAIASLSIDVLSEVPLAAGQTLQLAVSQTPDGVRLAVVGQGADAAGIRRHRHAVADALADVAATLRRLSAPSRNVLTPLERVAVSVAAQSAADRAGQPGAAVCQSRRRRRRRAACRRNCSRR